MRRRRRNKSTWFPLVPTLFAEAVPGTWFETTLTIPATPDPQVGDSVVSAFPLTEDNTLDSDAQDAGVSLADRVQGQDWLLERVVGKVWMTAPTDSNERVNDIIRCIALAVLPTNAGQESPSIPAEDWNPLFSRNAQQPWIWRRTWRLQNSNVFPAVAGMPQGYPNSTAYYGSMADGGHLDSKSKRRITKDHRLYIIAAASVVTAAGEMSSDALIFWGYDLRVLGGMRRGKNKSSF